ncbi:glycosyltransferase [Mariniblastus sp.]|nr:glycosyltransferase [Mariniblastus sp.]
MYFFKSLKELVCCDVYYSHGIFHSKIAVLFVLLAAVLRKTIFISSEPEYGFRQASRLKTAIKSTLCRLLSLLNGKNICLLAIGGDSCVSFYKDKLHLKFRHSYEFGYVVRETPVLSRRSLKGVNRLVFVGQLIERKNIERIVRIVSNDFPDVQLLVVGTGELESGLREIAGCNIEFFGQLESRAELDSVLSSCNYLILPSYFDGWGAVVNEAVNQGLGLLLSREVYSSRSLCRGNGYCFDPNSDLDISEAISRVLHVDFSEINKKSLAIFDKWKPSALSNRFAEWILMELSND